MSRIFAHILTATFILGGRHACQHYKEQLTKIWRAVDSRTSGKSTTCPNDYLNLAFARFFYAYSDPL